MSFDSLPDGWTVWTDETEGRAILAYRPDVFDTDAFPAPCMPTLFVSNRSRKNRPEARYVATDTWHVTLYLEPEVAGEVEEYDSREAAVEGAREYARRFAEGEIDHRALYQVPRDDYLAKLDELLGGGRSGDGDDGNGEGA
ncbi:DUF5820 family protein [Halobium salinum]|uniref:DUF5820 family protein n=1 Tax=Halobium salinum TaxID=1364940 RepID=A0ABD5PFD6_9EURY|nr:DUF5820 family protein [Halobium salinum]